MLSLPVFHWRLPTLLPCWFPSSFLDVTQVYLWILCARTHTSTGSNRWIFSIGLPFSNRTTLGNFSEKQGESQHSQSRSHPDLNFINFSIVFITIKVITLPIRALASHVTTNIKMIYGIRNRLNRGRKTDAYFFPFLFLFSSTPKNVLAIPREQRLKFSPAQHPAFFYVMIFDTETQSLPNRPSESNESLFFLFAFLQDFKPKDSFIISAEWNEMRDVFGSVTQCSLFCPDLDCIH